MHIKYLGCVPSNIKENKGFTNLSKLKFSSWKWEDGEWIKEPIRNIETSNDEVSND